MNEVDRLVINVIPITWYFSSETQICIGSFSACILLFTGYPPTQHSFSLKSLSFIAIIKYVLRTSVLNMAPDSSFARPGCLPTFLPLLSPEMLPGNNVEANV
jgi:hypothetical protein